MSFGLWTRAVRVWRCSALSAISGGKVRSVMLLIRAVVAVKIRCCLREMPCTTPGELAGPRAATEAVGQHGGVGGQLVQLRHEFLFAHCLRDRDGRLVIPEAPVMPQHLRAACLQQTWRGIKRGVPPGASTTRTAASSTASKKPLLKISVQITTPRAPKCVGHDAISFFAYGVPRNARFATAGICALSASPKRCASFFDSGLRDAPLRSPLMRVAPNGQAPLRHPAASISRRRRVR